MKASPEQQVQLVYMYMYKYSYMYICKYRYMYIIYKCSYVVSFPYYCSITTVVLTVIVVLVN